MVAVADSLKGRSFTRVADWSRDDLLAVLDLADELKRLQQAREEHQLFEREANGSATEAERERLKRLQVMLDQCWDLLRQRRARRAAGQDPEEAELRDEATVEGYIG